MICDHGLSGKHPDGVHCDCACHMPLDDDYEPIWCHTPKKCKIEKESGFCDTHESYECPVIATEPETPVPEATCEVHLEKDGRLCVTTWVRPDQMYATLSALRSTPELRERLETIAGYHDPHDSEGTQWCRACGTCFPCVTRVELDAVLDVLGEPK